MHAYLVIFCFFCHPSVFVAKTNQPPQSQKKSRSDSRVDARPLIGAVLQVNSLLNKFDAPDAAARTVVEKANSWEGEFSAAIAITRAESTPDDGLLLTGKITITSPDQNRYYTGDEREQLAAVAQEIRDLKAWYQRSLKENREREARDVARSREWSKGRSAGTNSRFAKERQKIKRKYKIELRELQQELRNLSEKLQPRVEERRAACEDVDIQAVLNPDLAGSVDMRRLLKLKWFKARVRVKAYELGAEHEEVGQHVRVSELTVTVLRLPSAVKKRPDRQPKGTTAAG